jgi:hypothetical protein
VPQSYEPDVSIRAATADDGPALARLRWEWAVGTGEFQDFADTGHVLVLVLVKDLV